MGFWRSLNGYIEVELESADFEKTFSRLCENHVRVYGIRYIDSIRVKFYVSRDKFNILKSISKIHGENVTVCDQRGVFWSVLPLLDRPVIVSSVIMLVFLTLWLPSRVLFVTVEGNQTVPTRKIIAESQKCGIVWGASRGLVRSEKVKNELIASIPELKWVGVNTRGCVAVISVKERTLRAESDVGEINDIVSIRDGIISEITVTNGTPLCSVGQAVVSGEKLISGYTNCDFSILAGKAQGEVFAYTSRKIQAISPNTMDVQQSYTDKFIRLGLIIGKKRINLWNGSGICPGSCDRIYKEYRLRLPGGFSFPLALSVEEIIQYDIAEERISSGDTLITEYAEAYLSSQMVSGKILNKSVSTEQQGDLWTLEGIYVCHEMIGRVQRDLIGDLHGEDS